MIANLINVATTSSMAPIQGFYNHENIQISARWSGETANWQSYFLNSAATIETVQIESGGFGTNRIFWQPDVMLSLYPRNNIRGDRRIRLYLAGNMVSDITPTETTPNGTSFSQSVPSEATLVDLFNQLEMRWGYVINGQIGETECSAIDRKINNHLQWERLRPDVANNEWQGFSFTVNDDDYFPNAITPYGNLSSARFIRRSPLSLNFDCFNLDQENTIDLFWAPDNSSNSYNQELKMLKINIRFNAVNNVVKNWSKIESTIKFKTFSETPYLFRIMGTIDQNYNKITQIHPLFFDSYALKPEIVSNYQGGSRNLQKLYTLEQQITVANSEYFEQIFYYFKFENLREELHDAFGFSPFEINANVAVLRDKHEIEFNFPLMINYAPGQIIERQLLFGPFPHNGESHTDYNNRRVLVFPGRKQRLTIIPNAAVRWNFRTQTWAFHDAPIGIQLGDPNYENQQNFSFQTQIQVIGIWNYNFMFNFPLKIINSWIKTVSITKLTAAEFKTTYESVNPERASVRKLGTNELQSLVYDNVRIFWREWYAGEQEFASENSY